MDLSDTDALEWRWTAVTALGQIAVKCESTGCDYVAEFCFRAPDPPRLRAYCGSHALAQAFRAQLSLPPKRGRLP